MATRKTVDDEGWSDPLPARWATFVECVCLRPGMYTDEGTSAEVAAFLNGYFGGLSKGSREQDVDAWEGFVLWLQKRLFAEPGESWSKAWRRSFPNDSTAIEQLGAMYAEFRGLPPLDLPSPQ